MAFWTQKSLFVQSFGLRLNAKRGNAGMECRAATWPGKKNKVLMRKCCSQVENIKVERSREGSSAATEPVVASGVPCSAFGGVAGCADARFAVVGIK